MNFRKINYILLAVLAVFLIASFSLHANADTAGGKHIRMMAQILKKADVPLDEAQIEQIKAIERGPEAKEQITAILSADQQEALKNAPKKGRGRQGSPIRMMAMILKKAGVPLDEAQIEQIKGIEKGPEAREQVHAVLTAEQLAVLENRFKKDIDKDGDAVQEETNDLQKPADVDEKPEAINLLKQNYPNPFNPATTIEFHLAKSGTVTLEIYGPNGQRLTTLVNGYRNAGQHTVTWDASRYAGGVYVCKITAGDFTESRKMMFVK